MAAASVIISSLVLLFSAFLQYFVIMKMRARREDRPDGLGILSPQPELEPENVKFEIVAVHGLGAHPEFTWTHSSRSKDKKHVDRVHLFRDLLMKDKRFSEARFLHFAYNSDWLVDAPVESAQEIGVRLMNELVRHRKRYHRVPIFFIGHSFGGIVIKQALCGPSDGSREILEDTRGIVFLGTPHHGSPISGLAAILASLTSLLGSHTGLLLSLQSNESQLTDLSQRFTGLLEEKSERGRKTKILPFCEKKPTYILRFLSVGLIVPLSSAAVGGNQIFGFEKDHSGLNKCRNSEDLLYKELTEQLCKLRPTTTPEMNGLQQSIIDRLRPNTVPTAMFMINLDNADEDEDELECLDGTRSEILSEIYGWFDDDATAQKHVYWLQGKAGTGKSTIARTVTRELTNRHRLAASFFFKRGEGDRGKAQRFFTTLISQLVARLPEIAESVKNAMESDPRLQESTPAMQFKKLIREPMENISRNTFKPLVVVVDALDECDPERDVATLIKQLFQPISQKSSPKPLLKFFLTSRPHFCQNPVFTNIFAKAYDKYERRELEEATKDTVEGDIRYFLRLRLGKITNLLEPIPGRDQWSNPEDLEKLEKLVELACPLFIFASTACRFIGQYRLPGEPKDRLQQILEHKKAPSDLQKTYLPALNQLIAGLIGEDRDAAIIEFKMIVGSIIALGDPLSVASISRLLQKKEKDIRKELELLESVFNVPTQNSTPVRIFHESFRDFLFGPDCEDFKIDETETHQRLADQCLTLLSNVLKRDICGLQGPGTYRDSISLQTIQKFLPPDVQYACLFWVHHTQKSQVVIKDNDNKHAFLETNLLFWLEALSLIGRLSESITFIRKLRSIVHPTDGVEVKALLHDTERFILSFRPIISIAPLQLYNSALVFAPTRSVVRRKFSKLSQFQTWIDNPPAVDPDWSPCLQTLEGHIKMVVCVAFSENRQLASASYDGTIKIWDPASEICLQTLKGHERQVRQMAFFANGKLVSGSIDAINIWDIEQGECVQTTKNLLDDPSTTFLDNGKQLSLVDGSHGALKTLNLEENQWSPTYDQPFGNPQDLQYHERNTYVSYSVPRFTVISADGEWLAWVGSVGRKGMYLCGTLNLLEVNSKRRKELGGSIHDIGRVLVFSKDSKYLAAGVLDSINCHKVRIWEVGSGHCVQTLQLDIIVAIMAFSLDNHIIAIGGDRGSKIITWDWRKNVQLQTLTGNSPVQSLAFSPNGTWLASGSENGTVQIWDTAMQSTKMPDIHAGHKDLAFMSGGEMLVSINRDDQSLKIWDTLKAVCLQTIKLEDSVREFAVSTKGPLLAIQNDGTIEIRDLKKNIVWREKVECNDAISPVFSADGERFVTCSRRRGADYRVLRRLRTEYGVTIWNAKTGSRLEERLEGLHWEGINRGPTIAISSDGVQVALYLGSIARTNRQVIRVWNSATTEQVRITFSNQRHAFKSMGFSENGKRLILLFTKWNDFTTRGIYAWDTTTGQCLLEFQPEYRTSRLWDMSFVNMEFPVGAHSSVTSVREPWLKEYQISPGGAWIMKHSEKLLWLPPEYRPHRATMLGSCIGIGTVSGRVICINLPKIEDGSE